MKTIDRRHPMSACAAAALLALTAVAGLSAGAPPSTQKSAPIVVSGTLEGALGQPRIQVQLSRRGRPLTGEAVEIEGLDLELVEASTSFPAFLDTGASACVLSESTVARFGVEREPDAVYHEVGLSGEHPMDVSAAYELSLADSSGLLDDRPRRFPPSIATPVCSSPKARFRASWQCWAAST